MMVWRKLLRQPVREQQTQPTPDDDRHGINDGTHDYFLTSFSVDFPGTRRLDRFGIQFA